MPLLSLAELAHELSMPQETLARLVTQNVLVPYGGKARLGEPRFSTRNLPEIRAKLINYPLAER